MKNTITVIALVFLAIVAFLIETYAKIQWANIFVANKSFAGILGIITMYTLEAIPSIVIYILLGVAIYKITKNTNQTAYLLLVLALIPSILMVLTTQWVFSGQVRWTRRAIEYSKVLLPIIFILAGAAISKRIEAQPNKAL